MTIAKTLFNLTAAAILFASCKKERSYEAPRMPSTAQDTSRLIKRFPRIKLPLQNPQQPQQQKDTVTLMVRDVMSYENALGGKNFWLEPLQVEQAVPHGQWPEATYGSTGTHKVTVKMANNVTPFMEDYMNGAFTDRYRNPLHDNSLGYANAWIPTDMFVQRNDGGLVAYGLNGVDTVKRAHVVHFVIAEHAIINVNNVNGMNPINNGVNNETQHQATFAPNKRLGQNGTTYFFN